MADFHALLRETDAYKTVASDVRRNAVCHAYAVYCADGENLRAYLKELVKIILCNQSEPCGKCRVCRLIDEENFADTFFYPRDNAAAAKTEDVNLLIEESFVKPIECERKIFVIPRGDLMTAAAQNKLLKTLEEPPFGVSIFIGATNEFSLLPTVRSRVKKLVIPAFSEQALFSALKEECPDEQKLKEAVACSDGTLGNSKKLYLDDKTQKLEELAVDVILNMKSSKDVLAFATKISTTGADITEFASVLQIVLRDMLSGFSSGKVLNGRMFEEVVGRHDFSEGAIVYALEKTQEAVMRRSFNANAVMLTDWLLFKILEGKYKWQK